LFTTHFLLQFVRQEAAEYGQVNHAALHIPRVTRPHLAATATAAAAAAAAVTPIRLLLSSCCKLVLTVRSVDRARAFWVSSV